MNRSVLHVECISKEFMLSRGHEHLIAIRTVDLKIDEGDIVCITGPSGCGKSTLLRVIAGLEVPTAGRVLFGGREDWDRRELAMVFQDYSRSLFPWFRVRTQLAVACEARGIGRERAAELIGEALSLTDLTPYANLWPHQLSGGMAQRVALARSLVTQPKILLLDEPFGSVDAFTRYQLEDYLRKIWEHQSLTIIMVTHDVDEAVYLADRVVVLTPRPAEVAGIVEVPLPPERTQALTRSMPEFASTRQRVWSLLHGRE